MKSNLFVACLVAVAPCAAVADKLGEHPAVIVKRLHAAQTYDYASKFYPHPAWLYLLPEAPRQEREDPASFASGVRQPERMPPRFTTRQLAGRDALRAMDCARCHGRDYDGWAAVSLIAGIREGSRDRFESIVLDGVPGRGMPGYRSQPLVVRELDAIYAFLVARARGGARP